MVFPHNNINKTEFSLIIVYLQQIQSLYSTKWIKNCDAEFGSKRVWRENYNEWDNQSADVNVVLLKVRG